ncbi:MAG: hypothetical protein JW806_04880 [Sedimentisphaerales bacterium]|nr:hypothetical protein [Sedimentisphaerales bacterium]
MVYQKTYNPKGYSISLCVATGKCKNEKSGHLLSVVSQKAGMPGNITFKEPVKNDGQNPVKYDGRLPSELVKTPVKNDDLLERNRRENRKATPLPLPVVEQSKALLENMRMKGSCGLLENLQIASSLCSPQ